MPDEEKPFHELLREWRGTWRQKEAADALGISPRTYQFWESGWSKPTTDLSMREVLKRMEETKR